MRRRVKRRKRRRKRRVRRRRRRRRTHLELVGLVPHLSPVPHHVGHRGVNDDVTEEKEERGGVYKEDEGNDRV